MATRHRPGVMGKRLVAVPGVLVLAVIALALMPILLPFSLVVDLVRRPAFVTTRVLLVVVFFLWVEVVGVLVAFLAWLVSGVWAGADRERFRRWNYAIQSWWGATLFAFGRWVFSLDVSVEGADVLQGGPMLIFIRHTSVADSLIPVAMLSAGAGLRLRYVLKDGLLWDPCMNIVGNRLPNCFVRRGAGGESVAVGELAVGLGPRDGVLIYPEGMVVTPQKAARLDIDELRAGKGEDDRPGGGVRTLPFDRVLRPRLGGPLALLERGAGTDVVFCGHVGFEVCPGVRDLARGRLTGARVHVGLWRVDGATVPEGRSERADWLYERWHEMDGWVGEHQQRMDVRGRAG